MEQITHQDFKKILISSWEKIEKEKEQINKINVFPVPDMDTGSNMAKTLKGIKDAIKNKEFSNLEELSEAVLEGALISAQGNAGVIYTGFLAGFLPLLDKNPIDSKKLAIAMKAGAVKARESIQNPKEGTILDVIDAATKSIEENSKTESNIVNLLTKATDKAKQALMDTREKMEILKKANVVDAGGLGFLMILESYLASLEPADKATKAIEKPSDKIKSFIQTISYRYEVVFLIKDLGIKIENLEKRLNKLGNSLEILQIKDKIKVHIHTDDPDKIKKIARESGKIINIRIEDMSKEILGEESLRKVSIGLVVEDLADLSQKVIERYQIEEAPAILDWPEVSNLPGENIYQKMKEAEKRGIKELGKTSQPSPKAYLEAYKKQIQKFEKILCITVTSKISGSYNSACQAKTMLEDPSRVYILDSLTATAGQGLLALRAIELIQEQREIEEVIEELKKLIPKVRTYFLFEEPKWIEAIGRITHSQANWIRKMQKMRIRPLMQIKDGEFAKAGVSLFAKDIPEALFQKIEKESKKVIKQGKKIRVIITHADCPEGAEKLKKLVKDKLGAEVPFVNLVCTIVGSRLGPGTIVAAWHPL